MTDATDDTEPAPAPADRTLSWWPIAAAAVVAAVFLTIIFVVGTDGGDSGPGTTRDADGALSCPGTFQQRGTRPWVPASPSGVDGEEALLPDAKPTHVTTCLYTATDFAKGTTTRLKLDGGRTLTAGLRAFARDLHELKKPAGVSGGSLPSGAPIYLLGATFATGFVWIAVMPDGVVSNGTYEKKAAVLDRVAEAYRSRAWT